MTPRSAGESKQLPPEVLCLIHKSDLSTDDLKKIYNYAQANPVHLSHHINRLEVLLTKLINPVECSCSNRNSVHFDFACKNVEYDERLQLSAACFSLIPFLKCSPQRLQEFQLRLSRCLCDSLSCLLKIHGLPHVTLSTVQTYLNSKVDDFSCIIPVDKIKKLPDDFSKLLIMRVDFFTYCLRYIFTRDFPVRITFCLPIFVSIFSGFFEVKLTDVSNMPNSLLKSSSRLMLCLDTMCQTVGTVIMPAVPCLLTLLTYHLEWTASWRLESKNMEYFVRLRLAALSCLLHLTTASLKFSYAYFIEMIPRIFSQLIYDLRGFLSTCQYTYPITSANAVFNSDHPKPQVDSPGMFEKRMLLAILLLIEYIFKDPGVLRYVELSKAIDSSCTTSKENPSSHTPVHNEVNSLLNCIVSLLSHINVILSYGVSHTQRQEKTGFTDLVSPPLLIALAKASFACAMSTRSQTFHVTVRKFFANLTKHSNSVVSLFALGNYHQLCGLNISSSISHEDSEINRSSPSSSQLTHQTKLVLPDEKYGVEYTSDVCAASTKVLTPEQERPPVKRLRMIESHTVAQVTDICSDASRGAVEADVSPKIQQEDSPASGEPNVLASDDINSFLTTFDPTFM
uniref:DUF5742 domain-containing protein n=2 Tax=Schistosoma mansoni TaxID=6183 RepID=A0A3Q0KLN0_SCHMA